MKKRSFIITIIALVVAMSVIVTAAAVYISSQARMGLFNGRIEQSTSKPNDPKLILKVCGLNVGQNDDYYTSNGVTFPILTGVIAGYNSFSNLPVYTDENGREPISAPSFILSAENGDVNNVYYKIVVQGNDEIAGALRFGVTRKYLDDNGHYSYMSSIESVEHHQTETCPWHIKSDDSGIAEGEEVEIFVSAWVDSDALSEIGEYDENASFNVDIIFFTKEL